MAGKVKSLQWLLTHSYAAKLLAVRRVSQNKGSKTAGTDGITWRTDNHRLTAVGQLKRRGYHAKPLRRVYIPKKNGKQRPLGIPCMIDKAQQTLYLLALEPISETVADKNSYGFRPKRSAADAVEQCFKALCRKTSAQWILEGDIKACFDKIGHQWLIDNILTDKSMLRQWLSAGYIDKGLFYHTDAGTPQGGLWSAIHNEPCAVPRWVLRATVARISTPCLVRSTTGALSHWRIIPSTLPSVILRAMHFISYP